MKRANYRRLILHEWATILARNQIDVPIMVVYSTYNSTCVDDEKARMNEVGEIAGRGVQPSRTLVPPRLNDVPLRLMNLRDTAVQR